jgi:hypothetical protein
LYFTKGAYRLENGQRMAGPGCVMGSGCENIGTQGLPKLSGMVYKPALVDEQAGNVMLRMNFGKGSVMSGSGTLDVMEVFKVYNDSMHCVYAIMRNVPEGTGFGWDYTNTRTRSPQSPALHAIMHVAGGVQVPLDLPCDKISLDIYSPAGRLVTTAAASSVGQSGSVFLPMDRKAIGAGYFIGHIRYFAGGKLTNSSFLPINTVR